MPSMQIRELDPEPDAEQVVELLVATVPTIVTSREEWLHRLQTMPERARLLSLVVEVQNRVVALGGAGLVFFGGDGENGFLNVRVHPDHRRRGIGAALYHPLRQHVLDLGAARVASMFDESAESVAFARKRGWREERAETLSALDPRTVSTPAPSDVELVPVAQLDTHELHRIDEEATRDMPSLVAVDEIPYDEWLGFVWDNPLFMREGSYGAVVDGHVAAISFLTANLQHGRAFNMFTATAREYRGRGLALAVKLASTHWAAENGITQIVTTNDETNAPMLAINRRLGYTRAGRRVEYLVERERLLREGGEDL
jgi:GNAT superfamily N-acetyltransferase